jgi:hypothetical protein
MNGSGFFRLGWADLARGLVLAALTSILTSAQQAISAGNVDPSTWSWKTIGGVTLAAVVAYLLKNLVSDQDGKVLGRIGAVLLAVLLAGSLSGCDTLRNLFGPPAPVGSSASTALSPREQAQAIETSWGAVIAAAWTAESSPLLADKPDVRAQIKATTHAGTDLVLAYGAAADNCWRDQATGVVGNAPGRVCDPSGLAAGQAAAQAALGNATALLTVFGFPPAAPAAPAPTAKPPAS